MLTLEERGQRLIAEARRKAQEMGARYLCHPANRVQRLKQPFTRGEPKCLGFGK
jgi:hypothetical protein